MSDVITRFAPSPTGQLHIGGIRTAIFNWAFARHHGGEFYLRIDDTDKQREVQEAAKEACDDLKWLGLDWDDWSHGMDRSDVMYQSFNCRGHDAAIQNLLADGLAYRDYSPPVKMSERKWNEGTWRRKDAKETGEGDYVIRLDIDKTLEKVNFDPNNIHFDDLILGRIEKPIGDIRDFVLARSNGQPLYNLATVVDDYDLRVSHIIRGQEHIDNTFPQILIRLALGYYDRNPTYAHIPYICAPNSNKKLSKRDDVPAVLDVYRSQGYFPEAIVNYLSHLGWSMGAEKEKWSKQELVENFDIKNCMKSPAQFDPDKMLWLNGQYMAEHSSLERAKLCHIWLQTKGNIPNQDVIKELATVRKICDAAGDRIKITSDITQYQHFLNKSFWMDPDAVANRLQMPGVQGVLDEFRGVLRAYEGVWESKPLHDLCFEFMKEKDMKPALLIHALRVATTGTTVGFGVFEGLEILGKDKALSRIDMAMVMT